MDQGSRQSVPKVDVLGVGTWVLVCSWNRPGPNKVNTRPMVFADLLSHGHITSNVSFVDYLCTCCLPVPLLFTPLGWSFGILWSRLLLIFASCPTRKGICGWVVGSMFIVRRGVSQAVPIDFISGAGTVFCPAVVCRHVWRHCGNLHQGMQCLCQFLEINLITLN